jgi:hypothetical protein
MLSRFMSLKAMLPKESGCSPVMARSRLNLSKPLRLSTQMTFSHTGGQQVARSACATPQCKSDSRPSRWPHLPWRVVACTRNYVIDDAHLAKALARDPTHHRHRSAQGPALGGTYSNMIMENRQKARNAKPSSSRIGAA